MHTFEELSEKFSEYFSTHNISIGTPETLYNPLQYFLSIGGKRIRPVLCLMGNELFGEIISDTWEAATAIELFHNFTLIHDDIMDKAPLRRGKETVHKKYGENTALLAGDVLMIKAYEMLNKIEKNALQRIMILFNKTATEVCEGQQLDMDFEHRDEVSFDEYLNMITLKTSVLIAAALEIGGVLGGGNFEDLKLLYEVGKNIGLAFQVQDDYLDSFGNTKQFGKQIGGDIRSNKKTFLLIKALQTCTGTQKQELNDLFHSDTDDKVARVLKLYKDCKIDAWAIELKEKFLADALQCLDDISLASSRKEPLKNLARALIKRTY
jgi:geranylgeranyl diphosphate synthase type II